MATQLGFYVDAERCVQCQACEVACKGANYVELGVKWRRVIDVWVGEYPHLTNRNLSISCQHCAEPACLEVCPSGAITKRASDGIVLVDRDVCIGCRTCAEACLYGAPQFGADGTMQKCILCVDRVDAGEEPACVATCPGEALHFGPVTELANRPGPRVVQQLTGQGRPSLFIGTAPGSPKADIYLQGILHPRQPQA
jgi:anaerobic dimethyl sulfoxide reductase subunit B (iron-sulfur subunit)